MPTSEVSSLGFRVYAVFQGGRSEQGRLAAIRQPQGHAPDGCLPFAPMWTLCIRETSLPKNAIILQFSCDLPWVVDNSTEDSRL